MSCWGKGGALAHTVTHGDSWFSVAVPCVTAAGAGGTGALHGCLRQVRLIGGRRAWWPLSQTSESCKTQVSKHAGLLLGVPLGHRPGIQKKG